MAVDFIRSPNPRNGAIVPDRTARRKGKDLERAAKVFDDMLTAVDDTFKACAISDDQVASLIDKTYVGNFCGECFVNQGHMGSGLAGTHPGLLHKPGMRVEGACASGALAVSAARDAIMGGSDVCLVAGVEVQTEKVWGYAEDYGLARLIVVNRMDRENASFERALESIQKSFGRAAVPIANSAPTTSKVEP